jgi:hypothetical protein
VTTFGAGNIFAHIAESGSCESEDITELLAGSPQTSTRPFLLSIRIGVSKYLNSGSDP